MANSSIMSTVLERGIADILLDDSVLYVIQPESEGSERDRQVTISTLETRLFGTGESHSVENDDRVFLIKNDLGRCSNERQTDTILSVFGR